MTELLYLPDNDSRVKFEATVERSNENFIVLDKTYFYPEGGGQPADRGTMEWEGGGADVVDVQKKGGDVRHYIENMDGGVPEEGERVRGEIDEDRREKHRRMHTAQHVLSRVVLDEYNASTAGNQIHEERSRIDFEPANFSEEDVERIERMTNEVIGKGLEVKKKNVPRDELEKKMEEGRTNMDLIPESVDPLRVVEIEGYDICPCGGTHLDNLEDIGTVRIIGRTRKGKDTERIEFELVE